MPFQCNLGDRFWRVIEKSRKLALACLFGAACSGSPPGSVSEALAEPSAIDGISITAPWIRATPPRAQSAGGYLTVDNKGSEPDRLVGASSPIASRVEVHAMRVEDGTMIMRPADRGLEIPAGGRATLEPGGLHLMFMGLSESLAEGTNVPVTLTFENAGEIDISLPVVGIGARGPKKAVPAEAAGAGARQ